MSEHRNRLLALAQDVFGFTSLRPGQLEVMEHLLAGRSAAAIFPTGGGKSLCYQLPALALDGVTLVVSPLIALMKDQIDALARRNIVAHRLDSSLSADEARQVLIDVRSGRTRLLYVAPERFNNERFRHLLQDLKVALFAIDEAHCISEWGHNFRPDYLKLAEAAKACGAERVLALTATATPKVAQDIAQGFAIKEEAVIRTPFYRKNLTLRLTPTTRSERDARLLSMLRERPRGPTLVYVSLQRTAEEVARALASAGLPAEPYHAGLQSEERAAIQDRFMASTEGIVVATIAFGMGVDKADIRYVYHYNLAKSLENLAQEIGRAGRDGEAAICESLVCIDDLTALENFAFGDTPDQDAIERFIDEVLGTEQDLVLDLGALSRQTDIRPLVLRTLLTYLELDGWLAGGTPLYTLYRFKPLREGKAILAEVDEERARFLAGIFKAAKKKKVWFEVDADDAARATGSDRPRIVRALSWLHDQGQIELEPKGVRHRYRRQRDFTDVSEEASGPVTREALCADLFSRMQRREDAQMKRLQSVLRLTETNSCQVRGLSTYFGDAVGGDAVGGEAQAPETCGHCSHCERGQVQLQSRTPPSAGPIIGAKVSAQMRDLVQEQAVLTSTRSQARFLCGLRSPAFARAKLTRHPLFGSLTEVPFKEVLVALEAMH